MVFLLIFALRRWLFLRLFPALPAGFECDLTATASAFLDDITYMKFSLAVRAFLDVAFQLDFFSTERAIRLAHVSIISHLDR